MWLSGFAQIFVLVCPVADVTHAFKHVINCDSGPRNFSTYESISQLELIPYRRVSRWEQYHRSLALDTKLTTRDRGPRRLIDIHRQQYLQFR